MFPRTPVLALVGASAVLAEADEFAHDTVLRRVHCFPPCDGEAVPVTIEFLFSRVGSMIDKAPSMTPGKRRNRFLGQATKILTKAGGITARVFRQRKISPDCRTTLVGAISVAKNTAGGLRTP